MATGFEDYILTFWSNPVQALPRCQMHLMALLQQQGTRTSADGVLFDPTTLDAAIKRAMDDFKSLEQRLNGVGQMSFMPTRRVDPGPVVGVMGAGGGLTSGN